MIRHCANFCQTARSKVVPATPSDTHSIGFEQPLAIDSNLFIDPKSRIWPYTPEIRRRMWHLRDRWQFKAETGAPLTGKDTCMAWNYGDVLDAIAPKIADRDAVIHDDMVRSWGEVDRRSNNLARAFLEQAEYGDKVGFYLRNSAEYTETLGAVFKARLTHVNVNFRYIDDELWYIFDNSDSKIVVYHREFAENIERLKPRLPDVVLWLEVDDGFSQTNDFSIPYESLAEEGDGLPLGIERSEDDLLFLYTGGTTGMPKGVMWRHADILGIAAQPDAPKDVAEYAERLGSMATVMPTRMMPCCPQMHGTGLLMGMGAMVQGGTVITLSGAKFDAQRTWEAVERHKISGMAIVGDAFAKPMLQALDDNPAAWDLSSLMAIISSGVMWSQEVKDGLLKHHAGMMLMDSFGSSEGMGFGSSVTTADSKPETAKFTIGENCKVFTEDHKEVEPGSGEVGFIALRGRVPVGYYKDQKKTDETFPMINGERWSMPGDYCTVEVDGTLTLLGRGSVSINSGGEKIYPEEIEEVLKTHPAVNDALVVGVPDEKWGQAVTGVVQMEDGQELNEGELIELVKTSLAPYKSPKRIIETGVALRAVNGKADYKAVQNYAKEALGVS